MASSRLGKPRATRLFAGTGSIILTLLLGASASYATAYGVGLDDDDPFAVSRVLLQRENLRERNIAQVAKQLAPFSLQHEVHWQ